MQNVKYNLEGIKQRMYPDCYMEQLGKVDLFLYRNMSDQSHNQNLMFIYEHILENTISGGSNEIWPK